MNERLKRLNEFKRLMSALADSVDEVIYHYTSAEGLRGIIENSEIWLTNVAFVNDTTECKALQEEKNLFKDKDVTNDFVRESWKRFVRNPYNNYDTYIVSFSRGEESLEQWRAYGNFRIGFKANKLISPHSNLYPCVYSKKEIKKWILEKEKLKEWGGKSLNDEYKRAAASNLIYAASKKYKNIYFEKESEVRLISISHHTWEHYPNSPSMYKDDPPIHYRNHPAYKTPVPYVKFVIDDGEAQPIIVSGKAKEIKQRKLNEEKTRERGLLPIEEILIGPMLHQEEARIACKILLSDKSYEKVKVNVSDIPYRGF